jgi:hypothetical protein
MFSLLMTGKVVVQDSGAVTPRCSYQQLSKELGPCLTNMADLLRLYSFNLSRQ